MKRFLHLLLTIVVLAAFAGLAYLLVALRKPPVMEPPPPVIPKVKVVTMQAQDIPLAISVHGSVRARTSTQLTAQVSGQIISVHPQFQDGGFFNEGEILLSIDPVRYETQVATAKAQVATAQLALDREEALAKRNRREWRRFLQHRRRRGQQDRQV
ncbi:MAG: multidrug efflux pump subunit AcrA (membrane-fusion protein) [Verrucomicrobiales bacterium]